MDNWFYTQQGQQCGPVTFATLQGLAATGVVRPDDQVWSSSLAGWRPAATILGLFPATPVSGPPVSGPPPLVQPGSAQQGGTLGYAGPMQAYAGQTPRYDEGTKWLLPVGRSGWAIAAGYLGLLSITLIIAPVALLFSLIAMSHLRRNPNLSGWGRAVFGLVMGGLFSIGLLLVLLRVGLERY